MYKTFDKLYELRDYDAAAETTTATTTAVNVPGLSTFQNAKIVLDVAVNTVTVDGSNYWTIQAWASETASGTYVAVGKAVKPLTAAGRYVIPLSQDEFRYSQYATANLNAEYIKITATETGTSGDLTYGAYLTRGN